MIALLGLLDLGEVGVQLFLIEERGAVDALKHLAVSMTLPVGPRDRQQLERADLAGVRNVRPSAKVDELTLAIEAQDAELVQLVVNVLDLVGLAQVGDELASLRHGQAEAFERLPILEDFGHLGLDGGEVFLGEAPAGQLDVVIIAAGRGRAEREPHAGKQPHDRPSHDVRGRMPQHIERLAVPGREDPQLDRLAIAVFQGTVEVDDRTPGHRRDGRVRQSLADPLGNLARAHGVGIILDRSIG